MNQLIRIFNDLFGTSFKDSNFQLVIGFVFLPLLNQVQMDYLSNVKPSVVMTGSSIMDCRIGHKNQFGTSISSGYINLIIYNEIMSHFIIFIMRSNNFEIDDPEVDVSFTENNQQNLIDENRLNMEMLRVHATQKQRVLETVWRMNQEELCQFFMNYRMFPHQLFTIKQLIATNNLKLVKADGNIYFGQMEKKKRNGKAILISKEGRLFQGYFHDNQKYGSAVQIYENGNLYVGHFLNNKKHGKGKFYWYSLGNSTENKAQSKYLQYYDGQWWGGLPDGQGIHQKINGDLYTGTFKNGLKHGAGSQYYGNGDYYKGEYINGLPQGFGEYLWEDNSFYKGDFKQGLRSGYGFWCVNQQEGAQNYQGHYVNDKKSGYGAYEWENGWIYKGNFENDYRNGYGQLYDGNKLVYKGYWENGEQAPGKQRVNKLTNSVSSFQLSGVSSRKQKRTEHIDRYYDGTGFKEKIAKEKQPIKMTPRPQFNIKKRPKSLTKFNKLEHQQSQGGFSRSNPAKKSNDGYTTIGSTISKPIMRVSNLYVPWQRSRDR